MQIKINNIGVINNAKINCNGLTVITGKNGSGKSTFCKSLTAFYGGVYNSLTNEANDLAFFIKDRISKESGISMIFLGRFRYRFFRENISERFNLINNFLGKEKYDTIDELYFEINRLLDDLSLYTQNEIEEFNSIFKERLIRSNKIVDVYKIIFNTLSECKVSLFRREVFDRHLALCIKDQFDNIFSGQVGNLSHRFEESILEIDNDNAKFVFNYNYLNTTYLDRNMLKIKNFFYVFDSAIIDSIDSKPLRRNRIQNNKNNDFGIAYFDYNEKLLEIVRTNKPSIVLESEAYTKVMDKILKVYPYTVLKQNGLTITNNKGTNIKNEASGSKIFIILKMLLERGYLNEETMLVFDEPENHLHPEWQNAFADVVSSINKYLGTNVVCVTHSPNMLLALEVFSKKNEIKDNFSCYYCSKEENFSQFFDVTNDIEKAHQELTNPYLFIDAE